jgi:hypothetical protein
MPRAFAARGGAGRARIADAFAVEAMTVISRLRSQGITAPASIAAELNAWGYPTPSGGANGWSSGMVRKVIARAARFTSDYRIETEDAFGNIDVLYAEVDGAVTLPFA